MEKGSLSCRVKWKFIFISFSAMLHNLNTIDEQRKMKNVLIENATHYCAYTAYSNAFGFDLPYLSFSWSDLYQTNMRPPCNSLEHLASIKSLIPSILQCVEREREWYRLTFRISRANTDYRLTDMANVNENARNRNEVKSERMPNNASEERRTVAAKKSTPERKFYIGWITKSLLK